VPQSTAPGQTKKLSAVSYQPSASQAAERVVILVCRIVRVRQLWSRPEGRTGLTAES